MISKAGRRKREKKNQIRQEKVHLGFVFKVEGLMHWLTTRTSECEEFWREGQDFRERVHVHKIYLKGLLALVIHTLLEVMR